MRPGRGGAPGPEPADSRQGTRSARRPQAAEHLAPPIRIGITGPIGCGKSTIARWLGELGAFVIDADQVTRQVTPPGSDVLASVVEAFGAGVLRPDGSLDRSALGHIVFADPAALARLEAIIHPAVRLRILELIRAAEHEPAADGNRVVAVVVEAIKLIEGGLAALCDEVWLLVCDATAQRQRLAARAVAAGRPSDAADTEARIAAQAGLVARLTPGATRIIDTSGSIAESRSRVEVAWLEATAPRP